MREVADQFDREHQGCEQNPGNQRHAFHWRSEEVQQIFWAGVFESLRVIVEERADRAAEGNNRNSRRRLEPGNQANQVADQDEDENDGKKRGVGLAVMANNLVTLAEHKTLDSLESMLQRSRRFHRKPRPDQQEEDQQETKNQQFHREGVADRRRCVLRLNMKQPQECGDGRSKQVIQDLSEPKLFRHESL